MKNTYIDTSILLANWVKTDPFHEECKKVIEAIKTRTIYGIISGLGLVEISSVVERQQNKFLPKLPPNISLTAEYLKRIIMVPNLEIIDIFLPKSALIAGSKIELSLVYLQAIDLAPKFHLKTLDNLHLATCVLINRTTRKSIDYFVSGDQEIVSKAHQLKSEYGFSSVFPDELIKLEGL
ncbi:MAG: PIN domain-containing protein [Candidatus Heimdallarchaeota archaeon]|nr:PIN domain-containing protein [Candidatus Heimdallarchaeota archaeon]